jgi:hypothetical protein
LLILRRHKKVAEPGLGQGARGAREFEQNGQSQHQADEGQGSSFGSEHPDSFPVRLSDLDWPSILNACPKSTQSQLLTTLIALFARQAVYGQMTPSILFRTASIASTET